MSSYKCFEEKHFELKPANFSMLFPGIETITLTHSLHYLQAPDVSYHINIKLCKGKKV